jgi:hypothetical protein
LHAHCGTRNCCAPHAAMPFSTALMGSAHNDTNYHIFLIEKYSINSQFNFEKSIRINFTQKNWGVK